MEYIQTSSAHIPAIGFGTFELEPDDTHRMVRHALDAGYRHVDTAQMYGNEAAVGQAIRESSVNQEEIFVTTKIWTDHFRAGDLQHSLEQSLSRLGLEAVDLVLLHWPNPDVALDETLGALLDARHNGLSRHVGISNFPSDLMRRASDIAGPGQLITNQVEYHPFLSQNTVLDTARQLGMSVSAYSPLARGRIFGNEVLQRIGAAHGADEAQVTLRWLINQRVVALPRTTTEAHADSNLAALDIHLGEDDHRTIERELLGNTRLINPGFAPAWDVA